LLLLTDHKCHGIVPQKRKDCGFLGISRNECEGKGCCFDENFGQGVPHCFVGVPSKNILNNLNFAATVQSKC